MRIAVTGHLGYIGAVLVPMLQDAGHEVLGYDTGLYAG
ncbi:MAG: NAD-dependent epimerase/dehydratase family protein, partial [Acidimicrobiia bacterium]